MVSLHPIDQENFWEVIALEVDESQRGFVTSNAISIAQAKVQPECIPLAIYQEDSPVGLVMYCLDSDDGEYWIYRLMVDKKHQGHGYGRAAMMLLLDIVRQDASKNRIYLGVHRESIPAVSLYQTLGFRFDGRVFGGEHIMVLEW